MPTWGSVLIGVVVTLAVCIYLVYAAFSFWWPFNPDGPIDRLTSKLWGP